MNKYFRISTQEFWGFSKELTQTQLELFEAGQNEFGDNIGTFDSLFTSHVAPKTPDWTGFKNAMFDNFMLLTKCLPCNTYSLVTGMILSAEAKQTVFESNFLIGWTLLKNELASRTTPLTTEEIAFINSKLNQYEFSITI